MTEVNRYSNIYERQRLIIEKKISKVLDGKKPDSLYGPGSYILQSGGKRLRPLLVLLSVKASGGKLSQVYNAALAVELLHNFTLVHDDIMDNADKRRGRLTIHKKYDVNTAILTGDSLLSIAYELLLKDCKQNTNLVLSSFNNSLIEVCEGQSLDKDFELRQEISIDEYYLMINKKTAALLSMCCNIGALLAGASKQVVNALSSFGQNIGMAFQIQDDMLDIIGGESFGKKIGGDLVEGKKTYLFIKALNKAKGNDQKKLRKMIKEKGIKPEEIDEYKKIYEKLDILTDAKSEIKRFTKKALSKLNKLDKEEDRNTFIWLADSLIKRSK